MKIFNVTGNLTASIGKFSILRAGSLLDGAISYSSVNPIYAFELSSSNRSNTALVWVRGLGWSNAISGAFLGGLASYVASSGLTYTDSTYDYNASISSDYKIINISGFKNHAAAHYLYIYYIK